MKWERVAAVSLTVAILFNTVVMASDIMETVSEAIVDLGIAYVKYKMNYIYPISNKFRAELIEQIIREEVEKQVEKEREVEQETKDTAGMQ